MEDPIENTEADGGFEDWEEEEDDVISAKSLFCDEVFPSIALLMEHDMTTYGFSLQEAALSLGMGDLSLIMLINFIRRKVQEANQKIDAAFIDGIKKELSDRSFLQSDENMIPAIQDDPLLFLLRDALGITDDEDDEDEDEAAKARENSSRFHVSENADILTLQQEMVKYKSIITALTNDPGETVDQDRTADDGYYFDSYSHVSIHETMLRDAPRTSSYAAALSTPGFLTGKVVLDVGCGTGILCMLAARAGAKKVIGIDYSSMIEQSRKVIAANGYSEQITLIRGKMEECVMPVDEVDVIVSEWMGYGLYFENMVSSVLFARDSLLVEGGVLMPSHAMLYIEAMSAEGSEDRVGWWGDVYGFDMTHCAHLLTKEAQVQEVDQESIVSDRALAHTLDMATATDASLDFSAPFSLCLTADAHVRSFAVSFDVDFRLPAGSSQTTTTLSTAAQAQPTHWRQTVLWLQSDYVEQWSVGDVICGSLEYRRRSVNKRDYDLVLTWRSKMGEQRSQTFLLAS